MPTNNDAVQRLFLGFSFEQAQVRQLTQLQAELAHADGKPVPSENLHLTLLFLGNVTATNRQRLETQIQQLDLPRFQQPLTRLSFWPKPKILCLTHDEVNRSLLQLQQTISHIAADLLTLQQHSQYRPHITLARKAKLPPDYDAMQVPTLTLAPRELHLYQSVNLGDGVQYPILHSWPLGMSLAN
ncbi:hypothetical protein HR45_10200 [Shewanella mangrovi]|uniref:RNA 2',3'-cyclic phosphodiesterase n=1 Tax=Shewanella mangrovi TaxID=1515746 RepID=A0A094JH88_9GAMM|nr:RNA 2',3'-cyclic phosphodiesterase [Shewanella mangrovi]KFZ37384.1 hypothetical protein HR45_10200 [Shewanella mangrovi]